MTAPFAAIEAATVTHAVAALANASATIGGVSVDGLFDNGYGEIYGIDSAKPSFQCASSAVAAVTRGTAVTVNAVSYTVAGIEPDGTGLTMLRLDKV